MIKIFLFSLLTILVRSENQTVSWKFGSFIRPKNSSVEFELKFISPTMPGKYPVIILLTGLDGIAPSIGYMDLMTKTSIETKTIIVSFDILRYPKKPDLEEKVFASSLEWTLENLPGFFVDKSTPEVIRGKVMPTFEQVSLMAHSASGHTVVSYLNETCGIIKTLILIDPVDGYDPFGIFKIYITNPPAQLPFVIPTLVIRTGLDPVPANPLFPACAPDKVSNKRFYDSLPGPTWFLNFTQYGHADILDDKIRKLASLICKVCDKDCEFEMYRNNVVKAIGLFYNGVNNRVDYFIQGLEKPNESKFFDEQIEISSVFHYNGYNVLNTGGFCIHK